LIDELRVESMYSNGMLIACGAVVLCNAELDSVMMCATDTIEREKIHLKVAF